MNATLGKYQLPYRYSTTDEISASDLRASLSGKGGKDVPEDVKSRLLAIHEENVNLKEQLKTSQEKLLKARAVCGSHFSHFVLSLANGFGIVYKKPRQTLQR